MATEMSDSEVGSPADVFSLSMTESVLEEKIAVARKSLQEIFVEGCGSLYNDLLDAIDDIDSGEDVCESEFHERLTHLMEEGTQLSESLPDLSNMISLRLSTVSRAMEQLKIKQDSESKKEKNTSPTSSLPQLRKWLKSTEVSIKEIEEQLTYPRGLSLQNLKRLLASQQVIQLHVETEGSSLVHTAKQQIDSRAFATNAEKKSKSLEVLTEKWHLIWLRSLGLQARIEKLIERREDKSESDSEGETSEDEPERKRRRTLSGSDLENPLDVTPTTVVAAEEDTIPFRADEYESIGADDDDETEPDAAMMTKAESETEAPKDRGYSSGENSMHESTHTLGDDEQRRLRIDASPVKSYYKTVPLDDAGVTDTETPRGMASCVSWPLEIKVDSGVDMTDSMIVNAESPPKVDDKYYLEVMQIMDECDEPHIDHFKNNLDNLKKGTEWREFKPPTRRISSSRSSQSKLALSRSISEKTSCDASSEESDDQHNKTLESWIPNDVGSTPVNYHIAMTRKRQRKRNTGSFLSEGLKHSFNNMTNSMFLGTDLNASIYASPEELMSQSFNSTVTSASRRRFGRRRMGRSNSDACFLSVSAIPLFQSTPNSRGSRRHVSGGDSDTTSSAAYEPSDTPAYEWDDYKPEAKDESTISVGDFLTAVHSTPKMNDDDYGLQLNGTEADVNVPAVCEMLTESKNHLNNALKMLSNPENDCNARNAVRVCAQSNIHRLVAIVNANPRMKQDMNDEICKVEEEWKTVLGSLEDPQPSPRPPSDPRQSTPELKLDLSAYQKLADTLRSSFLDESYIDSFKSIDDVDNMIRVYHKIHERLKEERNSFEVDVQKELARLGEIECDDLQELLKECDKCLLNIADTTSQLETLKENWLQWTKLGSSVESTMQDLECRLNNFGNSTATSEMIYEELEDCQNRMGHLETVCNFLTAHLNELSARPCSGYDHTDFAAEFKKYSGELEKIKMRYENLIADEKLNSTTSTVSVGTSTSPRKRRQAKTKSPSPVRTVTARPSIAKRIVTSIRTSIPIQILLGLTLLVAIGAFLYSYSDERPINRWRNSFGPHLDYVRGPPPV